MSCANILGSALNRGTVCSDDLFTGYGVVTLPAGAGPVLSPAVTVPFLKATDVIVVCMLGTRGAGAVPVGPITTTAVANPGTATASFQLNCAGVVNVATDFSWFVIAGETA